MTETIPDTKTKPPKAVLWLESSLTTLHIMHMAMLSRALQAKGFEVSILTSEDTIKQFHDNGGKTTKDHHCTADSEIDFGRHAHFLPLLASQTTYSKWRIPKVKHPDEALYPFNFIGNAEICKKRFAVIAKALADEKPDAVVTSLWPSGYGPFTVEIKAIIEEAKKHNPKCKIYSLSNDIPYLDYYYNAPREKAPSFELVDRTFVRGDGTIEMHRSMPLRTKAIFGIDYVGHFITPLPPKTDMPDEDRKVLVTFGTRESQWHGDHYKSYFERILDAAPDTRLRKQPWELIIGPHCPKDTFREIQSIAQKTAQDHHMRISVKRGIPDKSFKQATADAIFRICQYDIFTLDDVSSGIPAYITTGNIGVYSCGFNDGEDRLSNLADIGAPIVFSDQHDLIYRNHTIAGIDEAYSKSKDRKFSLSTDAPDKAAELMAKDYRSIHPNRPHAPDPVVGRTERVTRQTDPAANRSRIL